MRDWDKHPALLKLAERPAAGVAFGVIAGLAMLPAIGYTAIVMGAGIVLLSLTPERRRQNLTLIFVVGFISHLLVMGGLVNWKTPAFGLAWIALWAAIIARYRTPLWAPHAATFALAALLCALNLTGIRTVVMAGTVIGLTQHTLWRLSYWIKWRQRNPKEPVLEWLFTLIPFSGGGGVPIGKGPLYMARHEARDSATLAAAQLSGLKLIALAFLWKALEHLLVNAVFGVRTTWFPSLTAAEPRLPYMGSLLHMPLAYALWERWLALFVELTREILELAAFGHLIVGYFRLAGFAIPRNTEGPLLATTVLDFWNRYYFYFKELLVDFFFFPTYLRQTGMKPLPRTILATFVSAFLGNFYFHALLYAPSLAGLSGTAFLNSIASRFAYCLMLATGLSLSFWRSCGKKPAPLGLAGRLLRMAGVALFFALIHIWNAAPGEVTLSERGALFLSLFRDY